MVWNAARGGMRSVVEAYRTDGFLDREKVVLVSSYADGGFVRRQIVLAVALVRFAWLIAVRPVTLVHCHAAMRGSFWRKSLFARLARWRGIPVLFHLHGSEMKPFYDRQRPWVKALIARELTRASSVIVLSESWRDFVAGIAPDARPVILPNYVRVPAAAPSHVAGSGNTVLFLGLLGERKGIFDLLEALAEALRVRPDLRLIVGGNGQIAAARAAAAKLGIAQRVEFLGWVDPVDKQRLLEAADIFVLPSYNEGLPMSVLEAMAAGLPVITTDVGGIPELVIDDVNGILIRPGDRVALRLGLLRLAADPALRERLGSAAWSRVADGYSSAAVLARLTALYRSTEGRRHGTTGDRRLADGST